MMYRIDGTKKGYFFSYNEELLRIFKEINLTPYKRPDKRLSFTYRDETGKHCHLMAHNLAHGVYKGYIHYESFYEDVRAYAELQIIIKVMEYIQIRQKQNQVIGRCISSRLLLI